MKKTLLLTTIFLTGLSYAKAQILSPVAVTGFNQDVIAEAKNAVTSTSTAIDMSNNVWYAQSLLTAAGSNYGGGLPTSRSITSANNSNISYQLMPYNSNNALYMVGDNNSGTNTGTLSITTPAAYNNIAILLSGAEGSSTMDIKINFSDNSSTDYGSFTVSDWFDNADPAMQNIGRVTRVTGNGNGNNALSFSGRDNNANDPRLYEVSFALNTADKSKKISTISFTKNDNGATSRALVYAISGNQNTNILPVLFTGFSGSRGSNEAIELTWSTAQEFGADHFEIERSVDGGVDFIAVGKVEANGTTTQPHSYSFQDEMNGEAYYRICEVDLDGNQYYTQVIVISATGNQPKSVFVASANALMISSPLLEQNKVDYFIYNLNGSLIAHNSVGAGSAISVPVGTMAHGLYVVSFIAGNTRLTYKFIH